MRGIAALADVSPALIQHHFGTKDALRAECDRYVLDYLRAEVVASIDEGGLADAEYVAALHRSAPRLLRYLARALVDGTPGSATVFDELVALTERYLVDRPGASDAKTRAVVFTAMRLGVTVLHEHISRGLGVDIFSPQGGTRVALATFDIVATELLPGDLAEQARAGVSAYAEQMARAQGAAEQAAEQAEPAIEPGNHHGEQGDGR